MEQREVAECKEGGLEVPLGRVEDRVEDRVVVTMLKIEVGECKVLVEKVGDRVVAKMVLTVVEECKVEGLELQPEEEDRSVGDDPGEAVRFVGNDVEEEGEEEEDD